MKNHYEPPDILNSKIKKIRIELPDYAFSHSSSGDSHHTFIGRERIKEKLKKVIEDSPDEPGVYLIAGNRGVGKTSLVSWVINETSLKNKTSFTEIIVYLIFIFMAVAGILFYLQIFNTPKNYYIILLIASILILSFILLCYFCYRQRIPKQKHENMEKVKKKVDCNRSFRNFLGYYNRLYLRINFGHNLKEKDILRLIARTLSTEYHKYYHLPWRMLLQRVMTFLIIFIFACLFNTIVDKQEVYIPVKEKVYSEIVFSKVETNVETNIETKVSVVVGISLNILNDISSRIKKITKNILKCISINEEILNVDNKILVSIFLNNYPFWLSLIIMYLFCVLLSRCNWITPFFVTHQIINRRLKKLNNDITHRTELENSIGVNSEKNGLILGIQTKKSRNVADAREIEKELQDILYDMQRIPVIMCRPNIVIVFDELDKVEPGESGLDKENPQTKATLFSIHATRERQTEILRILSNMKYFLSTARAKFIFIAGREMFDIHLADVSERNNYIGSIFNVVILVPSFLTDHHTGNDFLPMESSIASLPEEFVCRKLIPYDYSVESYNLESYRDYLRRERLCDIIQNKEQKREVKQKIKKIIDYVENKEIEEINKIIDEQNEEQGISTLEKNNIKQFITEQNKKIERKVRKIITSIKNKNPEQRIKNIITSVKKKEIKRISKIIGKNEKIRIRQIINKQNDNLEQQINNIGQEIIQKVIAVLQQFIIYLAHLSKGAPKKMTQLFESFIEIRNDRDKNREDDFLIVQRCHGSRHFLSFNYYKQYTLGIVAYLITPIFYRLAESNIKEHSDKLLVSSLRFVDFLFKFHKHSFSWKILDISPEMLEVDHAPELKSVAVELLNYLAQIHINKSNFSLYDYKFDSWIANEIFAMAKTDDLFSALFSFSLDEMLPLKKHYLDLLEKTEKEYQKKKKFSEYIDAISSLQIVLGDLCYYNDELEEAGVYYKNAVEMIHKNEKKGIMDNERLYLYIRNKLKLGMIHEKRKQYDFAYWTYGELCERIILGRDIAFNELDIGIELRRNNVKDVFVKASSIGCVNDEDKKYYDNIEIPNRTNEVIVNDSLARLQPLNFGKISPNTYDSLFKRMTYDGLKMLYLPFIAKLQILEKSHVGGITRNHLEQLDKEFKFLTLIIDHTETKLIEAEFYSRVADILYYKNSDLKCKKKKESREKDDDKDKYCDNNENTDILSENCSCTACYYYHKALSILLGKTELNKPEEKSKNTVIKLLIASVEQLYDKNMQANGNYNVKFYTILARILSDWGNVFFSCDTKSKNSKRGCYICDAICCNTQQMCYYCACYICESKNCNTQEMCYNYAYHICDMVDCNKYDLGYILNNYINYEYYEPEYGNTILKRLKSGSHFTKFEITFAMYSISSEAYRKSNLYKRSSYQMYKMLSLFKYYKIYNNKNFDDYIKTINVLSKQAIHYLWYANDDLNVLELNKRKKDFGKELIDETIPLQNLLVDSEITKIRILVKELELAKKNKTPDDLTKYYDIRITSPYRINYSIGARIYRLWLKTKVNYETYQQLIKNSGTAGYIPSEIKFILEDNDCKKTAQEIFENYINFENDKRKPIIEVFENLIAESIYCLIDIAQLTETMEETYVFTHSFLGSIHEDLSLWIRRYEVYEMYKRENTKIKKHSHVDKYLKKYLDEEWREQLSGYRENQRALSHYYKSLEMHSEGRAYHNMIETMCYVKDDFNDRSDHFNIAEERHLIVNGEIEDRINKIKNLYKESKLYNVDNYYEKEYQ